MDYQTRQSSSRAAWRLSRRQHGVIARRQLIELGFHPQAIKHRVAKGRLHPVARGVYAVGRGELSREGRWFAALLSCGQGAVLSHESAAVLWGIRRRERRGIEVSVPSSAGRRNRRGVTVHRRNQLSVGEVTRHRGIPVTAPAATIADLALRVGRDATEAIISEADILGLSNPEALRAALDELPRRPGVAFVTKVLDRRTFRLTRSGLERRFLRIVAATGLPVPLTRQMVNGYEVDFYWPEPGIVVETDSLKYHRTAAKRTRDLRRDHAHAIAKLIPLRFSEEQIAFDAGYVEATLVATFAGTSTERGRTAAPRSARSASTSPASTGT
jgi:very-short-patch-repair endonuclease